MGVPTLSSRWSVLILLAVARIGMGLQFQALPPLAPLLLADLHLSYAQLGLLIGLFMAPGVVLALPAGLLGARLGDKPVVLLALGLLTAAAMLFGAAGSVEVGAAARLLGGCGLVLLNVTLTKIVTDWFAGRELATGLSILLNAWPIGMGIALATLGAVGMAFGWRAALLGVAAYTALMFVLVALLYRDRPAAAPGPGDSGVRRLWRIERREAGLILVAGAIWSLFNVSGIVFLSFAPALLVSRGMALAAAGAVVSLVNWAALVSVPLGGYVTDRSGRTGWPIVGGGIGMALCIGAVVGGLQPTLGMVLTGILFGLPAGAIMTLPGRVLRPEARATGFGLFYTVYYTGMAALPPVAGWLRDATGSAIAPLVFAGALAAGFIVLLPIFGLMERRWAPAAVPATGPATEPGV